MPVRIFATKDFDRFARKQRIADAALVALTVEIEQGLTGADLGGGLFKKRVARLGAGRSAGYRFIHCFRAEDRTVFLIGYAKNEQNTLSPAQEVVARFLCDRYLRYTHEEMEAAIVDRELREIAR